MIANLCLEIALILLENEKSELFEEIDIDPGTPFFLHCGHVSATIFVLPLPFLWSTIAW